MYCHYDYNIRLLKVIVIIDNYMSIMIAIVIKFAKVLSIENTFMNILKRIVIIRIWIDSKNIGKKWHSPFIVYTVV